MGEEGTEARAMPGDTEAPRLGREPGGRFAAALFPTGVPTGKSGRESRAGRRFGCPNPPVSPRFNAGRGLGAVPRDGYPSVAR